MGVLDDNLPVGSDTLDAPWNQDDIMERELEVLVSVTLSKTFKIKVRDYISVDVNRDEDGNYYEDIDCSSCDLKAAVKEQVVLPQEAYKYITSSNNESIKEDLKGWNIDDFEVVRD